MGERQISKSAFGRRSPTSLFTRESPSLDGDVIFVNINTPPVAQPKLVIYESRLRDVPIHLDDIIITGDCDWFTKQTMPKKYHGRQTPVPSQLPLITKTSVVVGMAVVVRVVVAWRWGSRYVSRWFIP